MKKFVADFKKFISRGSVIDLAIGLVIGAAFTSIVNSLVNDIIMPPIGLLFGGKHFEELVIVLKKATDTTSAVTINIGTFLSKVIDFFIIAFSVFLLVRIINRVRDGVEKGATVIKERIITVTQEKTDEKQADGNAQSAKAEAEAAEQASKQ